METNDIEEIKKVMMVNSDDHYHTLEDVNNLRLQIETAYISQYTHSELDKVFQKEFSEIEYMTYSMQHKVVELYYRLRASKK